MTEEQPSSIADAFEQLAHPGRLSIVRALLESRRTSDSPHVSFTELRDRSTIDDTGQFNYHLSELLGTYVRKTEDGYCISEFGHRVLAPLVGGAFDPTWSVDPLESPGSCPECREQLRIEQSETVLQLVCEGGHTLNSGLLGYPEAVAQRSAPAAVEVLGLLNIQGIEAAVAGVCPLCHGDVDGEITLDETQTHNAYLFHAPCETCGNQFTTTVGSCVTTHPAVVAFLWEHGIDARTTPPWQFPFHWPGSERVVSEEPLRLALEVESEGLRDSVGEGRRDTDVAADREHAGVRSHRNDTEILTVTVGRTGSVVSTDRNTT